MNLRAGQKVVCIDSANTNNLYSSDLDGLKQGTIYTIRKIGIWSNRNWPPSVCVWLEEIHRAPCPQSGSKDMPYDQRRFRPLVENKTDISSLEALLTPASIAAAKKTPAMTDI